ncbi:UPF0187-domain-containing protein [Basidiobolus meristosporus CBS 931.73]|uniref:UPF0187-domain-containing protein n=1 Tax=Basidiobolus meristosporus CBS 931.73 TaxID=1314790 RepID=A0A1Y1XVV5_9FUNG|nr:UPF0187-domain-containing protein [Basidiobolus meristosporus CBS 931.73]|eukprot:ORX89888.1 UPF0187-domain-containing protein [Basidiobolus meristosporus CBS 931.73]
MPPLYERRWPFALRLKRSIIPRIIVKVLFLTAYSAAVVSIHRFTDLRLNIKDNLVTILGMVTSLLLVFRTNTAYDRYWEGRRLWSTQIVNIRSLTRMIWINVGEKSQNDRSIKEAAIKLLISYAQATKHYLREEYDYRDVTPDSQSKAPGSNMPLEITIHLTAFIQHQKERGNIDAPLFTLLTNSINSLIDCLTGFERILRTPIPVAYSIHLAQTVWAYCLMLPYQIVEPLGWVTLLVSAAAAFTLFGILAIGGELENPFGYDWNDLPLCNLCAIVKGGDDGHYSSAAPIDRLLAS